MRDRLIRNLSILYPNSQEGLPVTGKLRTLLRQIDAGIDNEQVLANNSYLKRLVTECRLFLPEIFSPEWSKHWRYQVVAQLEKSWLQCELDIVQSKDKQLKIIDWSGIEASPLTLAGAYLLTKKFDLIPNHVSVVSLIANSLDSDATPRRRKTQGNPKGLASHRAHQESDRRIKFARRTLRKSDFCYREQDLCQRLSLYQSGSDLRQIDRPITEDDNSLALDIENIPEVALD